MNISDSLLIGYDYSENGDNAVLIVGKKNPNQTVEIINAFQGADATALYQMLTTKGESNA